MVKVTETYTVIAINLIRLIYHAINVLALNLLDDEFNKNL